MNRLQRVFGVGLIALLVLPFTVASLRMSGRVIVPADDVVSEDLYALGGLVIVEGVVDGDLFVIAGDLTVSGTVTGDVIALVGGPVVVTGTVGGSIRAAAVRVDVSGIVADDLATATVEASVSGSVGRDLLAFTGETSLPGRVGRDVLLQAVRLSVDGPVGGDVEVRTDTLRLGRDADVAGSVRYQASEDAEVADGAMVGGRLVRQEVIAPVWAKAVTRMISILSLLGLVVAGLIGGWLFRGTSSGAVAEVERHPWRSAAVGLAALLVIPILMLPLFLTLVGIPVALLLLVVWIVAIVLGPIPAVTRLGEMLLRGRGGLAGGLVVGALALRLAMWALPLIAGLLYLAALLIGLGAYVTAGWDLRRSHA